MNLKEIGEALLHMYPTERLSIILNPCDDSSGQFLVRMPHGESRCGYVEAQSGDLQSAMDECLLNGANIQALKDERENLVKRLREIDMMV